MIADTCIRTPFKLYGECIIPLYFGFDSIDRYLDYNFAFMNQVTIYIVRCRLFNLFEFKILGFCHPEMKRIIIDMNLISQLDRCFDHPVFFDRRDFECLFRFQKGLLLNPRIKTGTEK